TPAALDDFNDDGLTDIASVAYNAYSNDGAVFLGRGDGTFSEPLGFTGAAAEGAFAVASADFNGDGRRDVAVADLGGYFYPNDGALSISLGRGDGTFAPASYFSSYGVVVNPAHLVVADFN